MSDLIHQLGTYLHLVRASQQRQRPIVRDRLLLIAGEIAARALLPKISEYCRREILRHNPNHMLSRWATFQDALRDDEFQQFLTQQQRRFPAEKAEQMLESLGIQTANERDTYFSDFEYAAAILGMTPESDTDSPN